MNGQDDIKSKKHICIGLLAHVDAGKTTLSESLLYLSGYIRKLGRVDSRNAFFDTHELERARGITIFSKQAVFSWADTEITLLDNPGHVDFAAEMERTLQVLDMAVIVISGSAGIQGHTLTLWRLLAQYNIPAFIFINKMDQQGTDRFEIMNKIRNELSENCIDFSFTDCDEFYENIALCDERLLELYMNNATIRDEKIAEFISMRKIFPCFFGSALRLTGIKELLDAVDRFGRQPEYGDEFGARVYKIARDNSGNRLTYMKVTGGRLRVKEIIKQQAVVTDKSHTTELGNNSLSGEKLPTEEGDLWREKADQIRIYSGDRYESVNEAVAGTICAVTGLTKTYPGETLGAERGSRQPVLVPLLTYRINLPVGCEANSILPKLRMLEEEEPELHIVWDEQTGELRAQIMGEVLVEVLSSIIAERYGIEVSFSSGSIIYKETIEQPVEGVGHYEPLRHYAEVHLLLEPGEKGSGLQFATNCGMDVLERNWQRLILTHLEEKEHKGVLTGSSITDMKITLLTGRAHLKHTEGGDFRQATYRAVRQGLMKAKSVLLEPYYEFNLDIPQEQVGRALSDIEKMHGTMGIAQQEKGRALLTGTVPVVEMRGYQTEVASYTKGTGRLTCIFKDYRPCHNAEEIIDACGYEPDRDMSNPSGSIFCSHGAGMLVEWNQVENYMHLESVYNRMDRVKEQPGQGIMKSRSDRVETNVTYGNVTGNRRGIFGQEDKELEAIFVRTYGEVKRDRRNEPQVKYPGSIFKSEKRSFESTKVNDGTTYLLVDGYNIIFAWEELNSLAKENLGGARTKLMDILCNYQGFRKGNIILVFDAYRVEGHQCEIFDYHNIKVVYTKEAETADRYIEKTAHEIGRKYNVTVATSDRLEQIIVMGQGCRRLSANDLWAEIVRTEEIIRKDYLEKQRSDKNYCFQNLEKNIEHNELL